MLNWSKMRTAYYVVDCDTEREQWNGVTETDEQSIMDFVNRFHDDPGNPPPGWEFGENRFLWYDNRRTAGGTRYRVFAIYSHKNQLQKFLNRWPTLTVAAAFKTQAGLPVGMRYDEGGNIVGTPQVITPPQFGKVLSPVPIYDDLGNPTGERDWDKDQLRILNGEGFQRWDLCAEAIE